MLSALVEPVYAPLLERANDDLRELLWEALDNRQPIALRDYQVKARDAGLAEIRKGLATLLALATGCGKTELFLSILQAELEAGNLTRALILAHRQELIFQPVERMVRGWPALPCPGIVMADMNMPEQQIIVATVQTLTASKGRRMDEVLSHGAISHLVIDETHRAAARTYNEVIKRLKEANPELRILGVTATPKRSDGDGLKKIFQSVAVRISIKDAIGLGALVPFVPAAVELDVTLDDIPESAEGWDDELLGDVMCAGNALEIIVRTWKKVAWRDRSQMMKAVLQDSDEVPESDDWASHRPTIAFTASVSQARKLRNAFNRAGIPAAVISATTPKRERWEIIKAYKAGEIKILANCFTLVEGFDAPDTGCVLNVKPTKSPLVYVQMAGRGLRLAEGKSECLLLDFCPRDGRARGMLLAGDLLGKPKEQKKQEEKAEQLGIILDVFGISPDEGGLDADPDAIRIRILDFFGSGAMRKLAWTCDGTVASVSTGMQQALVMLLPQKQRVEKAETLKTSGKWNPLWENEYQHIRRFHLYALQDNRQLEHILSTENEQAAYETAERWADDHAEGWASGRSRKWRNRPPTLKREQYARKLGVWRDNMTDGACSQAITHELALRALRRKNFLK